MDKTALSPLPSLGKFQVSPAPRRQTSERNHTLNITKVSTPYIPMPWCHIICARSHSCVVVVATKQFSTAYWLHVFHNICNIDLENKPAHHFTKKKKIRLKIRKESERKKATEKPNTCRLYAWFDDVLDIIYKSTKSYLRRHSLSLVHPPRPSPTIQNLFFM